MLHETRGMKREAPGVGVGLVSRRLYIGSLYRSPTSLSFLGLFVSRSYAA